MTLWRVPEKADTAGLESSNVLLFSCFYENKFSMRVEVFSKIIDYNKKKVLVSNISVFSIQ